MKDFHNAEYCSPYYLQIPFDNLYLMEVVVTLVYKSGEFVDENGNFMIEQFKETVAIGIRFLDNVVDYNMDRHALEDQKNNATNDRRVGLGILGLGDMLVRLGIKYDSEDALQTINQIMQIFRDTAYEQVKSCYRKRSISQL